MEIIAGIDGSPVARQAAAHAARLVATVGGEVTLVRILDAAASEAGAVDVARASLEEIAGGLDVPTSTLVAVPQGDEDAARTLARVALEREAGMLCVATGGTGIVRRLLGSVTARLLAEATLPVMVCGPQATAPRDAAPYRVLVTTDGSPDAEAVLPDLARAFPLGVAGSVAFTLLHVYAEALGDFDHERTIEECEAMLRAVEQRLPSGIPVDRVVRELTAVGGIDPVIADTAETASADAIWMATHGHSVGRQALLGSVALSTLGRAAMPVVLVRAGR